MAQDRRSARALAALLPAGAFSLSVSLAAADASASTEALQPGKPGDVAEKLQSIRLSVSQTKSRSWPSIPTSAWPGGAMAGAAAGVAVGAMAAGTMAVGATAAGAMAGTMAAGATAGTTGKG